MKKINLLLLMMITVVVGSYGQGNFRFGIQTSPTFSWMTTDNNKINGNGSNLGFKLGIMGEYDIGENYSFIAGLNFAFNHGGTLKHDIGGDFWTETTLSTIDRTLDKPFSDGVNLKYNIQLVEIPFGLKLKTNEFGYVRYYAELPVFTIGIISKATGDIKGTQSSDTEKENISKEVPAMSMSWGIGGGVEFAVSSTTKLVGGIGYQKYFLDLTEVNKSVTGPAGDTTPEDSKATMGGIVLKLGIIF